MGERGDGGSLAASATGNKTAKLSLKLSLFACEHAKGETTV